MKRFLKRLALFCLLFLAGFTFCFVVLNYSNSSIFSKFRTNTSVTNIFIGDSHIQLGINDNLVHNSINLAQLSEPYKFTLLKLQAILKNNLSVKKVYLGFSYHNLSSGYDDVVDGEMARDVSAMYFYIFPFKEKVKYMQLFPKDILEYTKLIMVNGLKNLIVKDHRQTFLGHYENPFTNSAAAIPTMQKRLQIQYYENESLRPFSIRNMYYLDKIIELCRQSNVELILLSTPLQAWYKKNIPAAYIEKYNTFLDERNIKPLNLEDMPVDDSCFIEDGDHLSIKGASLLAEQLNK